MKTLNSLILLFLFIFSAACSTIDVTNDYDPEYNFSNLTTYDWLEAKVPAGTNELRIKRMIGAVDKELAGKGMKLSKENPDFLIALLGLTETKVNVSDYGYNYAGYSRWGGARDIDVSTYKTGTISLDFVDGKSKELFWRATGSGVVEPNLSVEKQIQKYSEAAAKMLEDFPPAK